MAPTATSATSALDAWQPPFTRRLPGFVRRFGRWLRCRTGPWVGVVHQYAPRPIRLPADYFQPRPLTQPPTISIVTPSFNQGRYLERTLNSVLGQDYSTLELIVQDGGSTDETTEILERFRLRLRYSESRPDRGQSHALNLGFRHATGEIFAYLNSDDLLLPGSLRHVADYFQKHPEIDVVYGQRILINENDEDIGRWILPPHSRAALAWNDYVPQETLFWRRALWEKVGARFDENLHSAMDWDLLLRFEAAEARFARLPRFLGAFRIHPRQKSDARLLDQGLPEQERLRTRFHGRQVPRWERWLRVLPYLGRSIWHHRLFQLGLTA